MTRKDYQVLARASNQYHRYLRSTFSMSVPDTIVNMICQELKQYPNFDEDKFRNSIYE